MVSETVSSPSSGPGVVNKKISSRLLSLDFIRGFIMVLLALEACGLFVHLLEAAKGSFLNQFFLQFTHHPWNGLRFWDLIQPGFMYMAGVSMAYSLHKQWDKGISWSESFRKTLKRCFWLFFWGVFDYAVKPQGLTFELWDVLTQLSFTTLVAFLIFTWPPITQIGACVFLLLLTEVLYRFTNIPEFDQPFVNQHNFGNYIDTILMNKINPGGWVAINCIPTSVHTIAGSLTGKLLLSNKNKVHRMLIAAVICLIVGFGLDYAGITPIIKRIATSSFILASLGWCLLGLAFCYWWIDILNHRKYLNFWIIVGVNSIFIYLFNEIVGSRWFIGYITQIVTEVIGWINTPIMFNTIITSLCVFTTEWCLCYFLYKKKIFFKL